MAKTLNAKSSENFLQAEISYFKKRQLLYFVSILLIGIALRLLWVLLIPCKPVSDFAYFYEVASNFAAGNGFVAWGHYTAWQGMGYPMLLGSFMRLVGNYSLLTAKLFNIILSSFTLITIFYVFRKLMPEDRRVANLAVTFLVFFPSYIVYNSIMGTEIVFTLLLSLIILLQLYNFEVEQVADKTRLKKIKPIYFGILVALIALIKPQFIVYPIIISAVEWLRNKDTKKAIVDALVMFATVLVVVSPWVYRNYMVFDRPVFITHNTGFILYVNNNSINDWGGWIDIKAIPKSENFRRTLATYGYTDEKEAGPDGGQVMRDPRLDPVLRNEALKWIVTHPLKFTELGFIRLYNLLFSGATDVRDWSMIDAFPNPTIGQTRLKTLFVDYSTIMFIFLSVCGVMYSITSLPSVLKALFNKNSSIKPMYSVPLLNFAMFSIVSFVFEGQPRDGFPLFVLFAFAASYIAVTIYDSFRNSQAC